MKIKAFLFDVDGVLYNSMPQHARSWVKAYGEQGYKISARSIFFAEGMTDSGSVEYLSAMGRLNIPPTVREKICARKRALYNKYRKPARIRGAKKLIAYLQKQGFKICLVTGSHQTKTISSIVKDFKIKRADMVTGKDVGRGKPHPEPFLRALKKVGAARQDAWAIENAPLGIQSAKKAGLVCVALKTGLVPRKYLKSSGADLIFNDCQELLHYISKKII